ncbi:hypothetical protein GCM10023215_60950 [Pseudonocardia yuanmonensis]|uniref:DUF4142 domain-containing protein n=1 Tax=Pseudonocardia yuanmonensis TaxID=1095914 RepID=A0ABP8XMI2_9PSEU
MRTILRAAGLIIAAVALVLLGPAAVAQAGPGSGDAGKGDAVSAQDKAFLRAAHQSNLAEIETGELAEKRGKDADVRALGSLFVKHHTNLDADLKKVAEKLDVDLPDKPNAEQRAVAAKLKRLSGDFDKAWLDAQIVAHRKALANGEKEQNKGSNDDVIELAKKSAPVIKDHLERLLDAKDDHASPAAHDTDSKGDKDDRPDGKHAA